MLKRYVINYYIIKERLNLIYTYINKKGTIRNETIIKAFPTKVDEVVEVKEEERERVLAKLH